MKKLTTLNPQPFPKGDKNYIDKFYLNRPNVHHYLYDNGTQMRSYLLFILKINQTEPNGFNKVLITTESMRSVMPGHK